jgi:hypothetical protein
VTGGLSKMVKIEFREREFPYHVKDVYNCTIGELDEQIRKLTKQLPENQYIYVDSEIQTEIDNRNRSIELRTRFLDRNQDEQLQIVTLNHGDIIDFRKWDFTFDEKEDPTLYFNSVTITKEELKELIKQYKEYFGKDSLED